MNVFAALALVLAALAAALLGSACAAFGSTPRGSRLTRMERSPQHDAARFTNPLDTEVMLARGRWRAIREFLFGGSPAREPHGPVPITRVTPRSFVSPPPRGLRLTWLGHATMLIEIDGHVVLTDPMLSERASPFGWAGPKRFFPAPIAAEELPPIDVVVISHDHYDHLDRATIRELSARPLTFVVPLGVGAHLEGWGVRPERIVELDWWEGAATGDGLRLVAAPARHFSGRGLRDRNRTLWSSWAILGSRHRIYFGGDSGSFPGIAEIGAKLGPFDVTLLDVGAYGANWPHVHMTPEEAVEAHRALGGKLLVPIHWGTFNLSTHGWTEPVERLCVAATGAGIRFAIPAPGQSVTPGVTETVARWWPELPWRRAEVPFVPIESRSTPHAKGGVP